MFFEVHIYTNQCDIVGSCNDYLIEIKRNRSKEKMYKTQQAKKYLT